MTTVKHYINGKDFGVPRNWQDTQITVDWLNDKQEPSINISDLEFVLEAKDYLSKRILDGTTGGVGVFESDPYKIEFSDNYNNKFTFDGYLDFTSQSVFLGNEEIICSLKKTKGTDWLNDKADGFSFAYLASIGVITSSDYVGAPYIINYVPDVMQLIVLSMCIFNITKELIENIQNVSDSIADITDASTPVIGVGVGFGAVAVTAWDIGNFILVVLKTLARILYNIAVLIAVSKLIDQIFQQMLPDQRSHYGMRIYTLFQRGCQHLNLELSSSLLSGIKDWVCIPTKEKPGRNGDTGYPNNTDPTYTFGDLIRVFKRMFNADYRIKDGIFYFERKDQFELASTYQLPSYFNDQERLLTSFSLNTDEIIANYNINWAYDVQDQNTLDDQTGRVFQAITTPKSVNNEDLVNIKNLAQVDIPFSLGKTKLELNQVEKIAKSLASVVDSLTGIFGSGTNYSSRIKNRVGSMLTTSHILSVPKIVVMSGSKLNNDQRGILSATNLWNNYHFINSFAEVNGEHNQYYRFQNVPVNMNLKDFNTIVENNIGTDANGNIIEIEKLTWTPEAKKATVDYRIKKKYTNNLKITYI